MPQSLSQIYRHTIFSTKNRFPFFSTPALQSELHAYLAGIIKSLDCIAIQIGGVADHVHLLTTLSRTITAADLVKETKRVSTIWLKTLGPEWSNFHWQSGYATFSVSKSQLDTLTSYIQSQATHHRTTTFQDEFRTFLNNHEIPYDEKYVWD